VRKKKNRTGGPVWRKTKESRKRKEMDLQPTKTKNKFVLKERGRGEIISSTKKRPKEKGRKTEESPEDTARNEWGDQKAATYEKRQKGERKKDSLR